jgi:hypothetical protein
MGTEGIEVDTKGLAKVNGANSILRQRVGPPAVEGAQQYRPLPYYLSEALWSCSVSATFQHPPSVMDAESGAEVYRPLLLAVEHPGMDTVRV